MQVNLYFGNFYHLHSYNAKIKPEQVKQDRYLSVSVRHFHLALFHCQILIATISCRIRAQMPENSSTCSTTLHFCRYNFLSNTYRANQIQCNMSVFWLDNHVKLEWYLSSYVLSVFTETMISMEIKNITKLGCVSFLT